MKRFLIRTAFLFFSIQTLGTPSSHSEEPPPPIDAQRFEVTPLQKSSSGKIYRFKSLTTIPKTGNLILTYDQGKPAMAFRVLKNDPSQNQFIGKRIRRYDQTSELKLNEPYSSIEKIADVLPPPPASTEPSSTIPEASPEGPSNVPTPEANDQELDSTQELEQLDQNLPTEDELLAGDEDEEPIMADESERINPFNNILSVTAGYFGNASNFSFEPVYNNGFSLSYSFKVFNDVFIKRKFPQDAVYLEMGGLYYRIINKDGGNDIYTMFPFYGNLFYQLVLSPSFSINLEAGLQYNYMSSATNPGKSLDLLQGPQINGGLGMFYAIGPQWLLRVDVGFDRFVGGLGIKW